jgi:kynurenine formamidase
MPFRVLPLVVLLLVNMAPTRPMAQPGFDPRAFRWIDLSHAYNASTLYWPTSPSAFELKSLAAGETPGGWYYAANTFCTPEHGGTHLDAPIHFAKGQQTLDQVPLAQLVGPAAVIDVSRQAAADRNYRLTVDDVRTFEARNGRIREGTLVLLRTGWSRHWSDRRAYFGSDKPGDASNLSFPSYGLDAARLLVEERSVGGLGVDTASIDYGASADFVVHRLAASRNVIGLENLTNLGELPAVGATVLALPIKVEGGSGGPVRAVAMVPAAAAAPGGGAR